MSKHKSLGSSPIGFQSEDSSYNFIPDLGVSSSQNSAGKHQEDDESKDRKKTVVSYYLEEGLVADLKQYADDNSLYYSYVVTQAIRAWLDDRDDQPDVKVKSSPFF